MILSSLGCIAVFVFVFNLNYLQQTEEYHILRGLQQTEELRILHEFPKLRLFEETNAGMQHIKTSDVTLSTERIQKLEKTLENFEKDSRITKKSVAGASVITEAYVISSRKSKFDAFRKRNEHSRLGPIYWATATDGRYQPNLDLWAEIIDKPAVNVSRFTLPEQKGEFDSPHAVGCYMSHWKLLQAFQHRHVELRPNLYFMFEDDASCVPNVRERVLEMTQYLPTDWDMIFLGGKHYSRGLECHNTSFETTISTFNETDIMRDICAGRCGIANSPLAPDGTRHLNATAQRYWRTFDTTDTEAYVINPHRIEHIMMEAKPRDYVPYDIVLARSMVAKNLSVYIPTEAWCTQEGNGTTTLEKPRRQEGYFSIKDRGEYVHHHWDFLYHEECIGNY